MTAKKIKNTYCQISFVQTNYHRASKLGTCCKVAKWRERTISLKLSLPELICFLRTPIPVRVCVRTTEGSWFHDNTSYNWEIASKKKIVTPHLWMFVGRSVDPSVRSCCRKPKLDICLDLQMRCVGVFVQPTQLIYTTLAAWRERETFCLLMHVCIFL